MYSMRSVYLSLYLFHILASSLVLIMPVSWHCSLCHYANMSVQYIAIFHGCKNGNFQMKKCEIFLIFAQNIDCGYTLEPPR